MAEQRRPIKVVIPQDRDMHPVPPGGSPPKNFCDVTPAVINVLSRQISQLEKTFGAALGGDALPAVACVSLKKEALAKVHRPLSLFNDQTCPIIGVQDFGELLISISNAGLHRLRGSISRPTQKERAAISTIDSIKPFTVTKDVGKAETAMAAGQHDLKVRLFNHQDEALNRKIEDAFTSLVRELTNHDPVPLKYEKSLRLFKVPATNPQVELALSGFVGVQRIGDLPQYGVDTQTIDIEEATAESLPPPVAGIHYPIIGLLDSGTDRANAELQAWVVGRDEVDVPRADQVNAHGSFVAGLLVNARGLNHADTRFPAGKCKVFDAVVFPKGVSHPEDDLIGSIRRVISLHHKRIKVWNLSISSIRAKCRDDCFSDFGVALDEIQDQYDVTIVTCTGNTLSGDFLRAWPCNDDAIGEADRMFPAGDSVRGLTVSAIAHQHRYDSLAKSEEPSPFSRRGPGPAFNPKPELSHYGGNCNSKREFRQTGILSVDDSGRIVERVGTSYAVPLVASVLGALRDSTTAPISRNLAKALMVQSAVLAGEPISAQELRYRGFGVPGDIGVLLDSPPWQATLIFEPELEPVRRIFERRSFPVPPCFRHSDGSVCGEIVMTLVYDPPLLANAGAEYCRVNVDVSLGTYDIGADGKRHHSGKIPLEPVDAKTLYEEYQLEHGFKWSPLKVYRKRLRRTKGDMWRIWLRMYHRQADDTGEVQKVALVITLQDPERKADVYNEVVREMNKNGWVTQDLQISDRLRLDNRL